MPSSPSRLLYMLRDEGRTMPHLELRRASRDPLRGKRSATTPNLARAHGRSVYEVRLDWGLRSRGTRDLPLTYTGPGVPLEQTALHEGVYSALERLEDGRHHHGRREVGQPGVFHVRQGEHHVLHRHEGDLVDAGHR